MSKFRKNSKNNYLKYGGLVLLLMLTLGYALLSANLNITGTSNFARTTWNIHFENLVPTTNMTLGNGEGASITQNKTTEVTYTLNFTEPGQYYEFLVDAKNDGTLDGMVNTVTSTKKLGNETAVPITTSPSNLPAYLEYSATYSDGTPIEQYHLLASGTKETYKVRIAFSTDIEPTDLPGSAESIELTFGVEYVQKDEHAVPSHPVQTVTGNYVVSSTEMNVGQLIPNGVNLRTSPELAMADWATITGEENNDSRPFYLKQIFNGSNQIAESYVEFIITSEMAANNSGMVANTYTLRGAIDESSLGTGNQPIHEANVSAIKTAFDYEHHPERCDSDAYSFYCRVPGLRVHAETSGSIGSCEYIDGDELYYCRIEEDGSSYCH